MKILDKYIEKNINVDKNIDVEIEKDIDIEFKEEILPSDYFPENIDLKSIFLPVNDIDNIPILVITTASQPIELITSFKNK